MKTTKRFRAMLLSLMTVCLMLSGGMSACAEDAPAAFILSGTLLEASGDAWLIETETMGQVSVLIPADGWEPPAVGQAAYILYDGKATRSIPAQITAQAVFAAALAGEVREWDAETRELLLYTQEHGEILTYVPESVPVYGELKQGAEAEVLFDGVMMMSLPGRINAGVIVVSPALTGVVTEMDGAKLLLSDDAGVSYEILLPEAIPLAKGIQAGARVRVRYDGKLARSIPAQATAQRVTLLDPAAAD